jgi:hypothetical protein
VNVVGLCIADCRRLPPTATLTTPRAFDFWGL